MDSPLWEVVFGFGVFFAFPDLSSVAVKDFGTRLVGSGRWTTLEVADGAFVSFH